jgi:hypothetical protein
MGRRRLCARRIGAAISCDGCGEFYGNLREGAARLRNGPIATLRLMCRSNFIDTTMRHGISTPTSARQGVKLVSTITILFGGIVEETTTAFKVGRIVGCAAGISVDAKKRFGHRQFGDKGVRNLFAVGQGASASIQVTGLLGDVLRGRTP